MMYNERYFSLFMHVLTAGIVRSVIDSRAEKIVWLLLSARTVCFHLSNFC